ncbi:MAG: PBP1A family penicillin-binding protein [Acidobacteriota bacterium]|nr:PBP1A family penicillin-binding protein [Acidobacteriota bacterium]
MAKQIEVKSRKRTTGAPSSSRSGKARVKSFQAPPPSFFRRLLGWVFNPITFSVTLLAVVAFVLTAAYFWFDYSDRIDVLLRGEVFTRSAGVYSAPKLLKDGEAISRDDLVKYLKSAGYIEKNQQAAAARSRYQLEENAVTIEPGDTAKLDDKIIFPSLKVRFTRDRKSVAAITDLTANKEIKETQLEPKILSSITAEGDGRRKAVTFQDLPPHLVKAITVTEDRAFFEHYGVNFRGILRALWRRYEADDGTHLARQGGSSITQQLVKNLFLTPEKSLTRKAEEAYMSVILETRLSKEEIFTLYANQIYLGQQAGVAIYGVGEAADAYFGKDVSQLNLAEAAFLAGIIRSPNRYNAYKNPERVAERRNQVLQSMLEVGEISPQQFEETKKLPINLVQVSNRPELLDMPYFTQFAEEELPKVVNDPEALQHLRVYTTIDVDLQRAAYEAVTKRLDKLEKYFPKKEKGNLQASLVAIKPKTGEIVAMIGGRDFLQNQFNRATSAQRQPGSVFKPFVYAAALSSAYDPASRVYTAATMFKDEKKTFTFNQDTYSPNNYGDTFSNKELTLRDALTKSKNVITVDLAMELNVGKVMNLAHKAGLPKVERAYPSMALGTAEATPLQMATAYTTFANLGDKVSPLAINRVTTGDGRTIAAPVAEKKNVLRPDVAYIMNDIMKDVINKGTATDAQAWGFKNVAGKQAFAGKTGTSRDGWFAGFTPNLVCIVYVGFDDGSDLGMKGSDSALPIWADFMRTALDLHPEWNGDWAQPDSVRKAEIDIRNGKLIRELDNAQVDSIQQTEKKNANSDTNAANSLSSPATAATATNPDDLFVTSVPPEFRRVELFISGTVPLKLLPTEETSADSENENPNPQPSTTPFQTWEEEQQQKKTKIEKPPADGDASPQPNYERSVLVTVCPLSGMRATSNCPAKEAQNFKAGTEPKDFCTFHARPRE